MYRAAALRPSAIRVDRYQSCYCPGWAGNDKLYEIQPVGRRELARARGLGRAFAVAREEALIGRWQPSRARCPRAWGAERERSASTHAVQIQCGKPCMRARLQFVSVGRAQGLNCYLFGLEGITLYFGLDRDFAKISRWLYSGLRTTLLEVYVGHPPRPGRMYPIGSYVLGGAGCHENGDHV
eukprot:1471454-Pleurochrysis_carterae.AAC.1